MLHRFTGEHILTTAAGRNGSAGRGREREPRMKTLLAAMMVALLGFGGVVVADDKAAPGIEGSYTVVKGV